MELHAVNFLRIVGEGGNAKRALGLTPIQWRPLRIEDAEGVAIGADGAVEPGEIAVPAAEIARDDARGGPQNAVPLPQLF